MKTLRICAAMTAACAATLGGMAGGAQAATYANGSPITVPQIGAADPYPSTIQVSGFPGTLAQARVTLTGIGHEFPRDLDILLAGPSGQNTVLMSDACDQAPTDLANATLTFDDFAAGPLPEVTPGPEPACPSGTYQTTDWQPEDPAELPPPAPAKTGLANLSVFNGTNPNGTWSLYVADDFLLNTGGIAGGWSLELLPALPVAGCSGSRATVGSHVGTDGNDVLTGTPGPDVLVGVGGNDVINGLGGRDVICGGTGDDTVRGGGGKDLILGQAGRDLLKGHGGKDVVVGGNGNDRLFGGRSKDTLAGGNGSDKLFGGRGRDLLFGQRGRDKLKGQKGKDICVGGPKRDKAKGCELIAKI